MVNLTEGDWLDSNRALWDERVGIHLASEGDGLSALRAGRGILRPIDEAELGQIFRAGLDGMRVLHLQSHLGADSLVLAQRGATVVGVDFSRPAVRHARALASEIGLSDRARFIEANVYDLRHMLPEPESFDAVFTTWGTIGWLPDVAEWARLIAWYLKPGGRLYFADAHPTALAFEGANGESPKPDSAAASSNFEWVHPLGETVSALLDAGLHLDFLHEHYRVPFHAFGMLRPTPDGMFELPGTEWLPLSVSIAATRA